MLVLKEEARLVLLRVAEVSDLVVLGENDAATEWICLILNYVVEPLNTIVNVFSVFLGCRVARLVFEVASVAVLEQEPRFPLFEHVFVLFGSATDAVAEWVEDVEF